MKKGYILLFLLFLISGLWAQNFTVEGIAYSALSANTVEVVSGGNYTGDLVIPASVRYEGVDYSVVSIKKQCFYRCGLTKVTLSNSIVSIGSSAFFQCADLQDIVLSNTLTNIGSSAFYQCSSLKSIDIPTSVSVIEGQAFGQCSALESVNLPSGLKSIPINCFAGCVKLGNIKIPNTVTAINDNAFVGCLSMTLLDLPASVSTLGAFAFSGCTGLSEIHLRSYYISIGESVFSNCTAIKKIYSGITNPGRLHDNVFYKLDKSACTLYVPVGSKKNYHETDGWKDFPNIIEFNATEVKAPTDYGLYVGFNTENNFLSTINIDLPIHILVFGMNSELCFYSRLDVDNGISLSNLTPGVYVVKVMNNSIQVHRKIVIVK